MPAAAAAAAVMPALVHTPWLDPNIVDIVMHAASEQTSHLLHPCSHIATMAMAVVDSCHSPSTAAACSICCSSLRLLLMLCLLLLLLLRLLLQLQLLRLLLLQLLRLLLMLRLLLQLRLLCLLLLQLLLMFCLLLLLLVAADVTSAAAAVTSQLRPL